MRRRSPPSGREARAHRRRGPGRRIGGHRGAPAGRQPDQGTRTAGVRGTQARRGRRARRQRPRPGPARRPHAAGGRQLAGQRDPAHRQAACRHGQGDQAGGRGGARRAGAGRRALGTGEELQRAGGLGEGQSGQGELRLLHRRHPVARAGAAAQPGGRARHDPRRLQGLDPRAHRRDGRARAPDVRRLGHFAAADQVRQDQGVCREHAQALADAARCADLQRARLSEAGSHRLDGPVGQARRARARAGQAARGRPSRCWRNPPLASACRRSASRWASLARRRSWRSRSVRITSGWGRC